MKRYKPVYRSCDQYGEIRVSVAEMEEDQYGEWVKYEDVLLLIETNEAMYNLIMSERLIKE